MESTDTLQELIARYQREMMAQYAQTPATIIHEQTPQPSKPSTENTAQSDSEELIDIGQLQVRVSTENQAVPIPGAVIIITAQREETPTLIRSVISDQNGLTPLMDLPTKDRQLTLTPGAIQPYATYNVDVTADGYFPKRFVNLPIYGGVTAVQNVSMVPLPEQGDEDVVLTYPQNGPSQL